MSTFPTVNPLWDFNLPADSLATLPDDDFLAILHSQIAEASNNGNNQGFQSFYLPQQPVHQENPANSNSKSLTQMPPTNTPPPLSDSTPSPPSGLDSTAVDETTNSLAESESNGWGNANGDDPRKRKASFANESSENERGPPSQRTHLAEQNSIPKAPSRRKSSGNPAADEQRLLKRKEQNRAAQRAFRERKEKHVKDLEDQLAAMAARNESTQAENDNLREMLRRLQAENTLLKQAAFTFSVPSGQSLNSSDSGTPSSSAPPPTSSSANTPSESIASGGTGLSRDLQQGVTSDEVRSPQSGPSQTMFRSNTDWTPTNSMATGAFPSPFTIISSNPTYMSYRDPAPSAAPFSTFMSSHPMTSHDTSLHSFTPQQQAYQNFLSPDVVMTDFNIPQTNMPSTSLDSANYTFSSGAPGTENVNLDDLYTGQVRGESSMTSYRLNGSPVSRATGSEKEQQVNRDSVDCCTKEGLARVIAMKGPSQFVYEQAAKEATKQILAGRQLPTIPQSDSNIDAVAAYQTIRNHPQFKDCDINNLCQEFAAKARCDGVKAVLPPHGMQELVESLRSRCAQA